MSEGKAAGCSVAVVFVLVLLVATLFGGCRVVNAGELGVKTTWGQVSEQPEGPGLHIVIPFMQGITPMSVQTHAYEAKAVEAASADLQTVHTTVTVNYHLDSSKVVSIYQTLRQDYEGRIISPAVQETVKASTAKFTAEELISKREKVKQAIESLLFERLGAYGITGEAVNITNFDFSDEFNKAIELKVTAEQRALQAKNDLQRIQVEAEQKVATARAEAESIRIRSDALANSPKLVEWEAIQKWDGKLPQITGGTTPFVSVAAPR